MTSTNNDNDFRWRFARTLRVVVASAMLLAAGACEKDLLANLPDAGPEPPPDARSAYVIYLNRTPTSVSPGQDDSVLNISSILNNPVTTTGSRLSDSDWTAVMACARELLAPFPIEVTDQDPGEIDHEELVITDSPTELGFSQGVFSVGSLACSSSNPRAIAFGFTNGLEGQPRFICEAVVAFPIGVAAGLSHSFKCEDAMSQLQGCGDKSFLDEDVQCGQNSPGPCACGGNTENTYQTMLSHYGALANPQ